MSLRPVILISAVSKELKTARQSVANTLAALGYIPDWQDIFPTDSGQLLAMLRKKVDGSRAVLQLVGQCYGAEPETRETELGRVSYTQYEALHAKSRGKKVYYVFLAAGYAADSHEPEPDELRSLQQAYALGIRATGDLRHPVATPADLENKVLRLRDDLAKLRRRTFQWAAGISLALLLIGGGVSWLVFHQKKLGDNVREVLDRDALLLAALRDFPAALGQATSFERNQSESSRLAAAYRSLEVKHGFPDGSLAQELPLFASQLLLKKDTSALDRANALLLQRKFAEAEEAALEAKDEALAAAPDVASRAIAALLTAGFAAKEQIHYPRALEHLQAANALSDKARDPLEWALVRQGIAAVLGALGRASEAAPFLREVVELLTAEQGAEHRNTLAVRNNLASTLAAQGENVEAEFRAVHAAQERVLGAEDPDTLVSRNNLANTLNDSGKSVEAEAEHRAVLAIRERVLGAEHPDTLGSRDNLAKALRSRGRNAEAEAEHRAVLAIRERVLGAEHPDTLASRNNLAIVLWARGRHAAAEAEFRAVLAMLERLLGAGHPDTLSCRSNLASALQEQGKIAAAETEHRAILTVRQRTLGAEHPDTLASRNNLAAALQLLGMHAEAETEHRTVLAIMERVLGMEHPSTLHSRYNLAAVLYVQDKKEEALREAEAASAGFRKVLGVDHPYTQSAEELVEHSKAE